MNIIELVKNKNYAEIKSSFREKYLEKLANKVVQEKENFLETLKNSK